jgi:hypothetical protein
MRFEIISYRDFYDVPREIYYTFIEGCYWNLDDSLCDLKLDI